MDRSRPPWEFHLLDLPTSEATSTVVFHVHHAYGDGMSLMALLVMSADSSSAETKSPPATPPRPRRTGAIYMTQRPALSAGVLAFVAWIWSYFVLAWNTAVDVAYFVATILFLSDPRTLFKRANGDEFHSKRFVHRSLSLDDVKFLKNFMNCTVNDVLVAVTSAALSRYYFRKSGDSNTKEICLRSLLPVNTRPATSLQVRTVILALARFHSSRSRLPPSLPLTADPQSSDGGGCGGSRARVLPPPTRLLFSHGGCGGATVVRQQSTAVGWSHSLLFSPTKHRRLDRRPARRPQPSRRREAPRASARPPPRPCPKPTRRPRSPSARARAPHPGRRSWRPRRRRSRSNVIGERLGSVFVQETADATGARNQRFFLALSLDTTADASRSSGASAATPSRQGERGQ